MKRTISAILFAFLCSIITYAHGSIIRYDITTGVDSEGYKFAGYVDFNSDSRISTGVLSINFDITSFLFTSAAGIAFGDSGVLGLTPNPAGAGINTLRLHNSYIENYVGKANSLIWSNALTGVWFYGEDGAALTDYTVLPYKIGVFPSDFMRGEFSSDVQYWGPDTGPVGQFELLTLTRSSQPIPEPATMLLLGGGLFGLAAIRKRFRK